MATYEGLFVQSVYTGERDQLSIDDAYAFYVPPMTSFEDISSTEEGIYTHFVYGYRIVQARSLYVSDSLEGNRVDPKISQPSIAYLFLEEIGLGEATSWLSGDRVYESTFTITDWTEQRNFGFSTYGINYQPSTPAIVEPIRRWPREWHGENMN